MEISSCDKATTARLLWRSTFQSYTVNGFPLYPLNSQDSLLFSHPQISLIPAFDSFLKTLNFRPLAVHYIMFIS
jgi:hypothetical protein